MFNKKISSTRDALEKIDLLNEYIISNMDTVSRWLGSFVLKIMEWGACAKNQEPDIKCVVCLEADVGQYKITSCACTAQYCRSCVIQLNSCPFCKVHKESILPFLEGHEAMDIIGALDSVASSLDDDFTPPDSVASTVVDYTDVDYRAPTRIYGRCGRIALRTRDVPTPRANDEEEEHNDDGLLPDIAVVNGDSNLTDDEHLPLTITDVVAFHRSMHELTNVMQSTIRDLEDSMPIIVHRRRRQRNSTVRHPRDLYR